MTAFFSKHKRSRSVLVAAAALLLCLCMCFVTACTDDTSSNTNQSTVKTDTNDIANGDFEYYTDDDRLELVIEPDSWSQSNGEDALGNSASASVRASGIVDTQSGLWNDLTAAKDESESWAQRSGESINSWMNRVKNAWDGLSTYDRLHFYEALEDAMNEYNDANDDNLTLSDFDLYSDYTYEITADDIPECENPGTHAGVLDKDDDETGVLMIHNYRTDGNGTAQRYTSATTVTLEAGTSAKLSVWVKTADLTYADGTPVNGRRGAYIGVTHTVGGQTLDQMQITNIDTSAEADNETNGWVQYTVYIKACSYASSTFTLVLGLGQGSSTYSADYVAGYAFFDDVELDIISNGEYDTDTEDVPACDMRSSAAEKVFRTDTAPYADDTVFALDLDGALTPATDDYANDTTVSVGLTTTTVNGVDYTTSNYRGLNIPTTGDLTGIYSWNDLDTLKASNDYLSSVWEDDFSGYKFNKEQDIIFLLSAHGAAYTAKMDATGSLFTLPAEENGDTTPYMMISFWVKTSDTTGYTGATVNLYDETTATALGPYNTTSISTVDLDDEEDIYDGWVQCFFFVSNETLTDKSFRLEFSYGPTTITGTTKSSYSEGYTAFTGFEFFYMTEDEFNDYAGSASQSTSVSLVGRDANGAGFDDVSTTDEEKIETNLANPSEYTGVNGGSIWVSDAPESADPDAAINQTNQNANAGLLNRNYVGGYSAEALANPDEYEWLYKLLNAAGLNVTDALNNLTWWNEIFGTSTQPLLISNAVAGSYGYIGNTANLSSNGYSTISLRVMVSENAKAYIYLIDTSDLFKGYGSTANVTAANVTYWYDDDGNICLSDPTEPGFNALRGTAFYRADNGLYRNNLDGNDTSYYANLANYEKDDDGNLIVRRNTDDSIEVTYDYADGYTDDGIAFYYNAEDQKYYAYHDPATDEYSTEVKDLSEATVNGQNFTAEYARYISESYLETLGVPATELGENVTLTNTANSEACIEVDGTQPGVANRWVTVSFYVRTGGDTFPYRLEVFSGSRDGSEENEAGTFVAFDTVSSPALSDNYDGLLSEAIDEMTNEGGYTDSRLDATVYLEEDENGRLVYASGENEGALYENAQYYAYTFYDDPMFQRYDQTLDENGYGDPYDGYVQSDNAEELTFLYYETTVADELNYSMFLNYNAVHQTVEADEGLDTGDETTTDNWWEDPDFWLMLSSIILAAVLIVVLIIMLVVKLVGRVSRRAPVQNNRYNAKRMRYIRKLNLQTEEDEDGADEGKKDGDADDPYND